MKNYIEELEKQIDYLETKRDLDKKDFAEHQENFLTNMKKLDDKIGEWRQARAILTGKPDNYGIITAVAEIDDNDVIIYLEKTKKWFFGLLDWDDRVTGFSIFTLSDKEEDIGVCIERIIHGFICRPQLRYVNIDTFNINTEFESIYNSYVITENRKKEWEQRLFKFESQYPDIDTNDRGEVMG